MSNRFNDKRCPYDNGKLKLTPYKSEKDGTKGFTLTCEDCGTNSTQAVDNRSSDTDENIKQMLADSWK